LNKDGDPKNELNPFQLPPAGMETVNGVRNRPNVFDWFFAIVLGLFAIVTVFPTTCFGGFFVIGYGLQALGIQLLSFGAFLFLSLLLASLAVSLIAAFWIAQVYIKAVKRKTK
jgi:hypothetical protein